MNGRLKKSKTINTSKQTNRCVPGQSAWLHYIIRTGRSTIELTDSVLQSNIPTFRRE